MKTKWPLRKYVRTHSGLVIPKCEWNDAMKNVQMDQVSEVDQMLEEDQEGNPSRRFFIPSVIHKVMIKSNNGRDVKKTR